MAPKHSRRQLQREARFLASQRALVANLQWKCDCRDLERRKPGIAVDDMDSAKRLVEVIILYTDGIEAFPADHPDLPQLETFRETFRMKECGAFVLTELQRRYPPVNQVPRSEVRLSQEPGIILSTATEILAGHEAFVLSIEDTVASSINPEELRNPSMHMQGPASKYHAHQGPGRRSAYCHAAPSRCRANFSTSDLIHCSNQGEIAELIMPTNGRQFIFAQFEVLKKLQDAYSQATRSGANL